MAPKKDKYILYTNSDPMNEHQEKVIKKRPEDVIRQIMPGAYDKIDEMRNQNSPELRAIPLHHSKATQYAKEGHHVISFNNAGSGHRFPMARYKIPGKKDVIYHYDNNGKMHKLATNHKRFKEIEESVYGKAQEVNGVMHKHVRLIEQGKDGRIKDKISMAGPLFSKLKEGAQDQGEYKIENLKQYIYEMGVSRIKKALEEDPDSNSPIDLEFRGHSRGAVATLQGAMRIKYFVDTELTPEQKARIHFHVMQFDPVPGPMATETNKYVDYDSKTTTNEMYEGDMHPLGADTDSTVVYSLHTQYNQFFTPQKIRNARRVIVTADTHDVGLKDIEPQTTIDENGKPTYEGVHHRTYVDAQTGEAYRMSGLSDLNDGLYILDQSNVLIKCDNYEVFEKYVNEMTSQLSAQKDRHELLKDVAKTYFADYDKRMERASMLHEGEKNPNSPEELLALRDYFKQMADDMRSTITTFHGSKEQFANVINSLDVAAKATENYAMFPDETSLMKFDKAISEMKKANEAYIEYKQDNVNGKTAKTRLGMARTLLGKIDDISASFQKHPKPKLDKGNKLRAEIRNMAETFQSDKLTVDQLKILQASFTTYAKDNQAKMKEIAEAMPNKNSQLYRLINETANLNPPNFFSYLGRLNMAKDMAMKEHTTDPKMEQCLSQIKDLASKNMENLNGSAKSIQKRFEMHEKAKTNDAPVL